MDGTRIPWAASGMLLVSLVGHGWVAYELASLLGAFQDPPVQPGVGIIGLAAPFLAMLVLVTGLLLWLRARSFPWVGLAVPWLIAEGIPSLSVVTQTSLTGGARWGNILGGVGDLGASALLVLGCVLCWRR